MKSKIKNAFEIVKKLISNSIRVSGMVWKERRRDVISLFFVFLLLSSESFLRSGSLAYLINELIRSTQTGLLAHSGIFALVLFIVANVFPSFLYLYSGYLSKLFWFFLQEKFELMVVKKKGDLDIATHESPEESNLLNKVSEGGLYRVQNFVDRQFYIFQNIVEVIIASAIIISFKWWVFLIVILGTIPELVVEAGYGKEIWDLYGGRAEVRRRFWEIRGKFDWVNSLMELKIFQNISYFFSLLQNLYKSFIEEQKGIERSRLWKRLLVTGLSQFVIAFALGWFVFEVVHGNILIGTLTFALASVKGLRQALSSLFANLGRWYEENLFMTDVFAFLDLKPKLSYSQKGIVLDPHSTPDIVFENVTFAYPNTTKEVLKNFSLHIAPGEKVAFVGINGAGKTTIVKLLGRFYDPTDGRILVGGHDLKEIDIESWYTHVGVLFQDYPNYRFLVKDTIAVGRTEKPFTFKRMHEAAKSSEADIFIEEWEKKYDQVLGKNFTGGLEPSGGQWQKLALARTFYRDPRVLILDEPTSAIDAESEAKIFERLEALPHDRTVILISHRFSTVRQADKIVVVENGAISEYGTHRALVRKKGMYARLFALQAKGYK